MSDPDDEPEPADVDPAEIDPEEVEDLSTEELIALSEGGVVDAEGTATAFGSAAPEEVDAAEAAADLVARLEAGSGSAESTQHELFSDEWIAAHTDFETVDAFLAAGPWPEGTEVIDVPTADLDAHAAAHTEFDTWAALSAAAGEEWLDSALDLEDL